MAPEFSYMVLGKYPAQSAQQLISDVWVSNAVSRWMSYVSQYGEIPPQVEPILGIDLAEYGTDYNVICLRYGGYVKPFILWQGLDPDDAARRALQTYREFMVNIAMVDGTGIGAGVAPSMVRLDRERDPMSDLRAVSVKVASSPSRHFVKTDRGEFYQLRDQMWWALREWLRKEPGAMLPNDAFLIEELKAVEYSKGDDGKIRITKKDDIRKRLKRSPDRADALVLTFAPFERARVMRVSDANFQLPQAKEPPVAIVY
jgi:hypothetical protein